MEPLNLVGPGQSIIGKNVVGILGGLEKTNFPKNPNPPPGGIIFRVFCEPPLEFLVTNLNLIGSGQAFSTKMRVEILGGAKSQIFRKT